MNKVQIGRGVVSTFLCASFLSLTLPLAALADTGDGGTLDQPVNNVTPAQDLVLPTPTGGDGVTTTTTTTTNTNSTTDTAGTNSGAGNQTPAPSPPVTVTPSKPAPAAPAAHPAAARPATAHPTARPAAQGPVTGRIEELCNTPGAVLPPLKALVPKLDNSKPMMLKGGVNENVAGAQALQGSAGQSQGGGVVKSFPVDYSGTWGGSLKVWTTQYGPLAWQFDPDEAKQESAILAPGREGSVNFTFAQDASGGVHVEPTQVVYTVQSSMSTSQMSSQLGGNNAQAQALAQLMGGGSGTIMVPKMYAMHLGNLPSGIGVTGNYLQSRVEKNEIRQLKPGVLEQTIVTRDADTNSKTGKTRQSYSENVLRFTRLNASQLYVQAAIVKYNVSGKFENKCVMYGTVNRGQATMPGMPGMPGLGGLGGFPGLGGGQGSGAGSFGGLDQMFKELNRSLGGQ